MDDFLEKLKNFLNRGDRFCQYNRIQIEILKEGYAEAVMEITDESLNGFGTVQGGALFTLADFAVAAAANSRGWKIVTQNASITYLRPGTGKLLRATATEVNRGRKTGYYEVEIRNEAGKLVAKVTANAFVLDERFEAGSFPAVDGETRVSS